MKSFFDFDKKVTEYEMNNNLLPKAEPLKEPEKNTEMEPEPTKPEPTKPEPTEPESTTPEPTEPEPTKPEPTPAD